MGPSCRGYCDAVVWPELGSEAGVLQMGKMDMAVPSAGAQRQALLWHFCILSAFSLCWAEGTSFTFPIAFSWLVGLGLFL